MSYQVFARKYRPRTFEELLGQDHVVRTLRNAIEQDRLAQAYLFVGPRGTGKTSMARILAKALNCPGGPKVDFDPDDPVCVEIAEGRSLDVLEIDGASNNSVDQIRDLRETVRYAPASGRYKIYYIDEVHMLSAAAFNALLKTLEEPPPHVKFIFATTEATKILPTIISRCQRFDLRKISTPMIATHLRHIASEENIGLTEGAALAIAKGADGGMRDAQSMLDQLVAFCGTAIDEQDVLDIFGFTAFHSVFRLAGSILDRRGADGLKAIAEASASGKDLTHLLGDLIIHFRNLLVAQVDLAQVAAEIPPEHLDPFKAQVCSVPPDKLLRLIDVLAATDGRMKWAPNKRLHLEIGLLQAIDSLDEVSTSEVIAFLHKHLPELGSLTPGKPEAAGPVSPVSAPAPQTPRPQPPPKETNSPTTPPEHQSPQTSLAPQPASGAPPSDSPGRVDEMTGVVVEKPEVPSVQEWSAETLWDGIFAILKRERPLSSSYGLEAVPTSWENHILTLSFHPSGKPALDSLSRNTTRQWLEKTLGELSGAPAQLRFRIDESLPPPKPPAPDPLPVPAPASVPSERNVSGPSVAGNSVDEEFDNDSLIEEALRLYGDKIKLKSTSIQPKHQS